MMFEPRLLVALIVGILLGTVFYGGLWWTVQRMVSLRWVALWFLSSLLLRTLIVLAGFYLACADDWHRWLAALLGFTVVRLAITRGPPSLTDISEADHAS